MGHLEARRHPLEQARHDERADAEPLALVEQVELVVVRVRRERHDRALDAVGGDDAREVRARTEHRERQRTTADLHRLGVEEADRVKAELRMVEQPDRGQPADLTGAHDDGRRGSARARTPPSDDEVGGQPADCEQNRREQPEAKRRVDTGLVRRPQRVDREDRHRRDCRRGERDAKVVERLEPEPRRVSAPGGHEADHDRVEEDQQGEAVPGAVRQEEDVRKLPASRCRRATRASSSGGAATALDPGLAAA